MKTVKSILGTLALSTIMVTGAMAQEGDQNVKIKTEIKTEEGEKEYKYKKDVDKLGDSEVKFKSDIDTKNHDEDYSYKKETDADGESETRVTMDSDYESGSTESEIKYDWTRDEKQSNEGLTSEEKFDGKAEVDSDGLSYENKTEYEIEDHSNHSDNLQAGTRVELKENDIPTEVTAEIEASEHANKNIESIYEIKSERGIVYEINFEDEEGSVETLKFNEDGTVIGS